MKKIIILALSAVFLVGVFVLPNFASALSLSDIQQKIQSLLGQVQQLQLEVSGQQDAGAATNPDDINWCFDFKANLRKGDTGKAVANLHTAMEKEGFAIKSTEKNNKLFGASTKSAVIGVQNKS
ncbi:MAG: hypothetical protein AAB890_01385, partial [Patescibacteria group bacterium]